MAAARPPSADAQSPPLAGHAADGADLRRLEELLDVLEHLLHARAELARDLAVLLAVRVDDALLDLGRTREIQRRFNVSVSRARAPEKASTLRDRSKR